MAVTSLILGILSLLIAIFGVGIKWLACILGLIGIILGALGRKNLDSKGMATAGMVMSIIGTILGLLTYLACAACVGGLMSAL